MPFARLSIRYVKNMCCVCVLEIILSPQQMVMCRVRIRWTDPPLILIILLIILGFGVKFTQLYINYSCPNCQFADLTYTGWCYWYHVQSRPERVQLQNCLDSALAKLENRLKANKHTKLNNMCHNQLNIFILI